MTWLWHAVNILIWHGGFLGLAVLCAIVVDATTWLWSTCSAHRHNLRHQYHH